MGALETLVHRRTIERFSLAFPGEVVESVKVMDLPANWLSLRIDLDVATQESWGEIADALREMAAEIDKESKYIVSGANPP